VALAVALIVAAGFMIIPIAAVLGKFAPAPPLAESSAATALAMPAAETH
jgi:hypothetical protein